jgi:hypothetical protein
MTHNDFNPSPNNQCPQCGQEQLSLSDNACFRYCEQCNYRIGMADTGAALQNLIEDTTRAPILSNDTYKARASNNLRIWLVQGINAAQAGEMEEAYYFLIKVLRSSWDNADRVKAWFWLSKIMPGLEEKRYCLECVISIEPGHGYARKYLAILDGRLNPNEIVDPETLELNAKDGSAEIKAEQFICPQCAGPVSYHSVEQVLLCEYCHHRESIDNNNPPLKEEHFGEGVFEQEFTIAIATAKGHLSPVQMRTFQCHSCAVEFVLPPEVISITCPYCCAVYVTPTTETREIIPPHALIPFQLDEEQARKALRGWFKKHNVKQPKILLVLGIYLPVWTFNIGGEVKWTKRDNTELLGLGFLDSPQFRKNEFLPYSKPRIKRFDSKLEDPSVIKLVLYDDVLVPASKKLVGLMKQFAEYDLSKLVNFDSRYLADWLAERYQVSLSDASLQARKTVINDIYKNAYKFTNGGILPKGQLNTAGLVTESYKQILLPLWIAHYQINKQEYQVTINGQTGRVHGNRPEGKVGRFLSYLLGT